MELFLSGCLRDCSSYPVTVVINLQQALTGWNQRLASKAEQLISRDGCSVICLWWSCIALSTWMTIFPAASSASQRERSECARGPRASSCPSRNQASLFGKRDFFHPGIFHWERKSFKQLKFVCFYFLLKIKIMDFSFSCI